MELLKKKSNMLMTSEKYIFLNTSKKLEIIFDTHTSSPWAELFLMT